MTKHEDASQHIYQRLAQRAEMYREQGLQTEAARLYRLAGEHAAELYANEAAVNYFGQALRLSSEGAIFQRYALVRARERIYDRGGKRDLQEKDLIVMAVLADTMNDDEKRAEAAIRQADYRLTISDFEMALIVVRMGTRMAQLAGGKVVEAAGRIVWGKALLRKGEPDAAQTQLDQALQLAKGSGDLGVMADAYRAQSVLALNVGRLDDAEAHLQDALRLYGRLHDTYGKARVLNNLGDTAYRKGQWAEAQTFWNEALPIYHATGDRSGESMIVNNLGSLAMDVGDYAQAQQQFENSLQTAREIGQRFGECISLLNLGLTHLYLEKSDTARDYGQQALTLAQTINSKRLQAYAWTVLGQIYEATAAWDEAEDAYWQSLALWHEMAQRPGTLEQHGGLARVWLAQDQEAKAVAHAEVLIRHLDVNGALVGIENPFLVYLTLYRVLAAAQDSRAAQMIADAHTALLRKAATIVNPEMQQSFLQNVAVHREIAAAYAAEMSK